MLFALQILESEPSLLNGKDEEGYTPLHLAVIAGNSEVKKELKLEIYFFHK